MKLGLWILILALTSWTIDGDHWIATAWADTVVTATSTTTNTITAANGSVITQTIVNYSTTTTTGTSTGAPGTSTGSTTNTNCSTGGQQYGGGQWNWCNRTDPSQQQNTQNDTKDLNNSGADQSTMLGMAAIAAGMAMVAAGMALIPNPPTTAAGVALVAAGMALIASGMAALAAASKMNNNANQANTNAGNLNDLNPYQSSISSASSVDGGTTSLGTGATTGIKIDPALTRTGKLDTIFGDMENKTGLNRDAMLDAVGSGANPLDVLANSPALSGKPSSSSANLQKMMDDTMAKGNLPSGQEVMDKLGLNAGDLGSSGGADMNRNLASANASPNLDALFPGNGAPGDSKSSGTSMKLSSEVQAALDKNGITSRSIFDMVHSQYNKKAPMMFGVQQQKNGTSANPYSNLSSEKIEI